MILPPQIGELAHMFTLPSTEGAISLVELVREPKVVLAFNTEDLTLG